MTTASSKFISCYKFTLLFSARGQMSRKFPNFLGPLRPRNISVPNRAPAARVFSIQNGRHKKSRVDNRYDYRLFVLLFDARASCKTIAWTGTALCHSYALCSRRTEVNNLHNRRVTVHCYTMTWQISQWCSFMNI